MVKPYVLAGFLADPPLGLEATVVMLAVGDHVEALETWLENCQWESEYLVFTSYQGNKLLIKDPYIQYVH
jgi:hypothetical protein